MLIRRTSSGIMALAIMVLAMVSVGGCKTARQVAAKYPRADIETLYATSQAGRGRNPVVLIHGFAGATLRRVGDGATAWGSLFAKDSLLPSSQQGLWALALDVDQLQLPIHPSRLTRIEDDTEAVAILERIKADAGPVDLNVGIYAALVELMEESGYGECVGDPAAIADLEKPPCLSFFYDWRQDNVGNAIRLGVFLDEARDRIGVLGLQNESLEGSKPRFDLVAHSMGGLVARYLLRYGGEDVLSDPEPRVSWAGGEYMDRLIIISTPNFGAMRVMKEVVLGRRYPMVKFEPAMIATWVSAYQMLPRPDHAVWVDEQGAQVDLDVLSSQTWADNQWGPFAPGQDKYLSWIFPEESSPGARALRIRQFMDAAFARAADFNRVMDQHPEAACPTELTLFAADVQPTPARAMVSEKNGRKTLRFDNTKRLTLKAPGDGSVTRTSALADERLVSGGDGFLTSPIPWDHKVFLTDMHMTFLANPTFQNNLLHILLETPPKQREPGE